MTIVELAERRWIYRKDSAGEMVRQPALRISATVGSPTMSDRLRLVKSPPPVDDPLRLIVAKAVYGLLRIPTRPFDEQPDHIKDMWFEEADAALAAIREHHDIVRTMSDSLRPDDE